MMIIIFVHNLVVYWLEIFNGSEDKQCLRTSTPLFAVFDCMAGAKPWYNLYVKILNSKYHHHHHNRIFD